MLAYAIVCASESLCLAASVTLAFMGGSYYFSK